MQSITHTTPPPFMTSHIVPSAQPDLDMNYDLSPHIHTQGSTQIHQLSCYLWTAQACALVGLSLTIR